MNMLINTVMQEKVRIEHMLSQYRKILEELPKGSISERTVKDKTYFYLKYRDGKRVKSKYISREKVDDIRMGLEKRKHTQTMIDSLQKEYALAQKILEGNI